MRISQAYRLARKGSLQEKEAVIRWAYSGVPHAIYDELCDLAGLSMEYLDDQERQASEPQWFTSEA